MRVRLIPPLFAAVVVHVRRSPSLCRARAMPEFGLFHPRYAHMSISLPGDPSREATERDGLNTPPIMPDEPMWMTEAVGSPDGGDGGQGRGLGWRGGRRGPDGDRNNAGSSRPRTIAIV